MNVFIALKGSHFWFLFPLIFYRNRNDQNLLFQVHKHRNSKYFAIRLVHERAVWNFFLKFPGYGILGKKCLHEPRHNKTNKMSVRPAKTQISLGIRPVWSESSLCAKWVAKDPMFLQADSEYSDQTGRRLIWVFAGRTATLLVLSWGSSHWFQWETVKIWRLGKLKITCSLTCFWCPFQFVLLFINIFQNRLGSVATLKVT